MGRRRQLSASERKAQFEACVVDLPKICQPPESKAETDSPAVERTSARQGLCGGRKQLPSERIPVELARRVLKILNARLDSQLSFEDVVAGASEEEDIQEPAVFRLPSECPKPKRTSKASKKRKDRTEKLESRKRKKKSSKKKHASSC
jgi:hypothetical protein